MPQSLFGAAFIPRDKSSAASGNALENGGRPTPVQRSAEDLHRDVESRIKARLDSPRGMAAVEGAMSEVAPHARGFHELNAKEIDKVVDHLRQTRDDHGLSSHQLDGVETIWKEHLS